MCYRSTNSLLAVLGCFSFLSGWALHLKALSDQASQNIYWDDISASMSQPNSALVRLKGIENPALLSIVFDAEWAIHHGKQPTFSEAIGRNFLFNAVSSLGTFVVLHPDDAPRLHELVDELSQAMKIKKPMIIYSDIGLFNAFATGLSSDNSCIVLCRGMLEKITTEAAFGVVAHEMGHIMHNHTKKKLIAVCSMGVAMTALFMQVVHAACAADKKGPAMLRGAAQCFSFGLLCVGFELLYARRCEREADQAMGTYLRDKGRTMLQSMLNYEKNANHTDALAVADFMKTQRFRSLTAAQQLEFKTRLSQGKLWVNNNHNCRGLNALFSSHPSTQERLSRSLEEFATEQPA